MLLFIILNSICSFLFLGFFSRFFGIKGIKFFSFINILINLIFIFLLFINFLNTTNLYTISLGNWISSGNFLVEWNFIIDDLTIIMLIVVNFVSTLVHLYSIEYMNKDPHLPRFMSYLTLFTFFMVMSITADNFIQLFLGWEGVGLCSYLLINFWFTRIQANKSALKAIIVNRISDFGLTFGIILIFYFFVTTDFIIPNILQIFFINKSINLFFINNVYILTLITIFLFIGAVGKSAQIFLHTWLPDAMEGPTPVSALIHAATMVTAGVFLIIKCSNLFEYSYSSLMLISFWGAITSIFAATSGLFLSDIKKVIAYSTCSQLGYMILICGFSSYNLSLFHLMNHAIFKAALFLCAGAIIHSLNNEQDMRRMGGLLKLLPISYIVMFIASLAIIGFPFLTGFYSKDFIFEIVFNSFGSANIFIYWIISITALFTTMYSFRILYLVFFTKPNSFRFYFTKIHESSFAISIALIILAIGSIFNGYIFKELLIGFGNNFLLSNINPGLNYISFSDSEFIATSIKFIPLFMGIAGISFLIILNKFWQNTLFFYTKIGNFFFNFLVNKWYFDYIYNYYVNYPIFNKAKKWVYKNLDKGLLELFGPFGFWKIIKNCYNFTIQFQTGNITLYLFIYGFFSISLLYLINIDFFFSFFFLNIFFTNDLFKNFKFWIFKNRYLFWLVKTNTFLEYVELMEYFTYRRDDYWLLTHEIEYDAVWITDENLQRLDWEYWSSKTTYDFLLLKSFLNFGWVYWPYLTLVLTFLAFIGFGFLGAIFFAWLNFKFSITHYFITFYLSLDLENFIYYEDQDFWIVFMLVTVSFWGIFTMGSIKVWNHIYNKSFFLLRKSQVKYFYQDLLLIMINIFFVILILFFFYLFACSLWEFTHRILEGSEATRAEYDPMCYERWWRYHTRRRRPYIYKVRHVFSSYLWRVSQTTARENRWKYKLGVLRYYVFFYYSTTNRILDLIRTPNSMIYTYDIFLNWINLKTWQLYSPFTYISYTSEVFPLMFWRDSFTLYIILMSAIILKGWDEDDPSWMINHLYLTPLFTFILLHLSYFISPAIVFFINSFLGLITFYLFFWKTTAYYLYEVYFLPYAMTHPKFSLYVMYFLDFIWLHFFKYFFYVFCTKIYIFFSNLKSK